jgi:hypothetical protein
MAFDFRQAGRDTSKTKLRDGKGHRKDNTAQMNKMGLAVFVNLGVLLIMMLQWYQGTIYSGPRFSDQAIS